ncbi:MAG: hypothetical protein KJ626_01660 [Verrucomicrobia bacterium]|nr:hypothetical protein [Verrucomicrobiota bacterium]
MRKLIGMAAAVVVAATSVQASSYIETIERTGGSNPTDGEHVVVTFQQHQNPGCPAMPDVYLYLGIDGNWEVHQLFGSQTCAPFSSSGSTYFGYTIPALPVGTVVEYVFYIDGPYGSHWCKAGSDPAFNEWATGYTYYGEYQNFQYTVQPFGGDVYQWPPAGQVRASDELWINLDISAHFDISNVGLVYSTDGVDWQSVLMQPGDAVQYGMDHWYVNMGTFSPGTEISYAMVTVDDNANYRWVNNGDQNYMASVNPGDIQWAGDVFHYPDNSDLNAGEDLWVNVQSWPQGAAQSARVVFSVDGGPWMEVSMSQGSGIGANDNWYANLGAVSSQQVITYAILVEDGYGQDLWLNNDGQDYVAYVAD